MEGITLRQADRSILFGIEGYEFPFEEGMDEYDVNRLTVAVEVTDAAGLRRYTDSCVFTFELRLLLVQMKKILDGRETGFISEFSEPHLRFSVTGTDGFFTVQLRYTFERTGGLWKETYAVQGFDEADFSALIGTLEAMLERYPTR